MKIKYSQDVLKAIKNRQPIVVLESAIITHGLPYPTNLEMAIHVEKIIKDNNAVPATVCIMDGNIHIGLEKEELNSFVVKKNHYKISSGDLSYVLANQLSGGTTVSATIQIMNLANLKFFATGGIGGVHKNFTETLDISNDLEVLANNNVCIVSSGFKSILDIKNTLEYLETKGVPVVGYKTDCLPAFYSSTSPYKLNKTVDSLEEIVEILKVNDNLKINKSLVVANPVKKEDEIDYSTMEKIINLAVEASIINEVKGQQVTPFLLDFIRQATNNQSLITNLQLVYNNAFLASKIAFEYYKQKKKNNN